MTLKIPLPLPLPLPRIGFALLRGLRLLECMRFCSHLFLARPHLPLSLS